MVSKHVLHATNVEMEEKQVVLAICHLLSMRIVAWQNVEVDIRTGSLCKPATWSGRHAIPLEVMRKRRRSRGKLTKGKACNVMGSPNARLLKMKS